MLAARHRDMKQKQAPRIIVIDDGLPPAEELLNWLRSAGYGPRPRLVPRTDERDKVPAPRRLPVDYVKNGASAVSRILGALCLPWLLLAGGCGTTPDDYFPLSDARGWEYRLTLRVLDETTSKRYLVRNAGTVEHEGRRVSIFEHPDGLRHYYVRDDNGVRRIATARAADGALTADGDEHFILREPLAAGTAWELGSRLALAESVFYDNGERIRDRRTSVRLRYVIESTDDHVQVPAGSFNRCVRVRATGSAIVRVNQGANFGHVDVDHTDWYAPGVGLVKSHRIETSDSPYLKPGEFLLELDRRG